MYMIYMYVCRIAIGDQVMTMNEREESQVEDEDVAGGDDIHSQSNESDSDEREESQSEDEDGTLRWRGYP